MAKVDPHPFRVISLGPFEYNPAVNRVQVWIGDRNVTLAAAELWNARWALINTKEELDAGEHWGLMAVDPEGWILIEGCESFGLDDLAGCFHYVINMRPTAYEMDPVTSILTPYDPFPDDEFLREMCQDDDT